MPGRRRVEVRDFPIPEPGPGQVLLRMKASSLCGSDLRAIYRPEVPGPEPYTGGIAGHEPCGVVERPGPGVSAFRPGDRVVVYHIMGCGYCHECRTGWHLSCSEPHMAYGWERDGGHAEFLLAEAQSLVRLPDSLSFVDGALVACGFGTAYAACCRAAVSGRDRVLITGMGPVGQAAALLCRAMGARVVCVESVPERQELTRALGFDTVSPSDVPGSFEVCIDCSGNAAARRLCLESARRWGRVVYVGEGGTVTFEPSPLLIHKQLTLHGSWVCSIGQMEDLVELLDRWGLHPEITVTHRFGIEDAARAYEEFDSGKTGKVVLVF